MESFVPTTAASVWAEVDDFLRDPDEPITRFDLGIDDIAGTTIEQADELFKLRGDEADQELGWIVKNEFRDFVAIHDPTRSVLVMTTSMD